MSVAPTLLPYAAGTKIRPVGLMDKASASGAGVSRFESWAGQVMFESLLQLWLRHAWLRLLCDGATDEILLVQRVVSALRCVVARRKQAFC